MAWRIRVSKKHPRGRFRRGGQVFTTEPTLLDELTPALRQEMAHPTGWLIIEEMPEQAPEESLAAAEAVQAEASEGSPAEDLEAANVATLREIARAMEIPGASSMRKQDLIEAVRAA